MNFLQKINNSIKVKGTQPVNSMTVYAKPQPAIFDVEAARIGNEMSFYAANNGENLIKYGYNLNYVVHSCINIIQKLFGKVPFYVVNIKQGEAKSFREGQEIIKNNFHDIRAVSEYKRIRKKTIDGIIEDNKLAKFLNRPNRNQSGTNYRETLIGYKKLTGEGNQWFNRGLNDDKTLATDNIPMEMFILPKYILQLVGNTFDPWEIVRYKANIAGVDVNIPKQNLVMWNEINYNFDPLSLSHLRGLSPLEAAILNIQSMNDGSVREINESQNGGANGLLFRKDAKDLPSDPAKISHIRQQINQAVNGQDVAGTIAWLAGEWGYLPFGKTAQELQRIEISQKNADAICNVLGVPPGVLKSDQTYANAPAYFKQLVYGVIAPEAYSLRDLYSTNLIDMFKMDRDRYAVDCDVLSLPELSEDLKTQIAAVKDADWLSDNEKRIATGYEPKDNPLLDLTPKEIDGMIGGNLDTETDLLNQ